MWAAGLSPVLWAPVLTPSSLKQQGGASLPILQLRKLRLPVQEASRPGARRNPGHPQECGGRNQLVWACWPHGAGCER